MTLFAAALRRGFCVLFVVFGCLPAAHADRQVAWTYTVTGETSARTVAGDNGTVYLLSDVVSGATPSVRVSKLEAGGPAAWQVLVNEPFGMNRSVGMARDPAGNLIVVGLRTGLPDRFEPFLAKLDTNGTLMWRTTGGPPDTVDAMGPVIDATGHAYLVRKRSFDFGSATTSVELVKFSPGGDVLWVRDDLPLMNEWKSIAMSPAGHIVASSGDGLFRSAVTLVGDAGNVVADLRFLADGGPTPTTAFDPAGPFYVVRNHGGKVWVTHFRSDFGMAWEQTFTDADTGRAHAVDSMGNLIVLGRRSAQPGGDALVFKVAPWAALQWVRGFGPNFGGPLGDALAVTVGANDALYVTGQVPAIDGAGMAAFTAKFDANGAEKWSTWAREEQLPGLQGRWIGPEWTSTFGKTFITALATDITGSGADARLVTYHQDVNVRPTAVASANLTSGVAPLVVHFSGLASRDADGGVTDYAWSLGGPTFSWESEPAVVFSTAGTYAVYLSVRDDRDGWSEPSAPMIITVTANQPPVAVAAAKVTSGSAPLAVQFSSAGSRDAEGSLSSYSWNFGNGASSALPNPSYTFVSPGTYTVRLTVTDSHGATSLSQPIVITVNLPPPSVQSLALASTSVLQSSSTTGTVTLSNTRGATVALRSSDTAAASVPATVVVPAGSSVATFQITTLKVKKAKTVTITATANTTSASAALTVKPR